jgi:hypothetical protein
VEVETLPEGGLADKEAIAAGFPEIAREAIAEQDQRRLGLELSLHHHAAFVARVLHVTEHLADVIRLEVVAVDSHSEAVVEASCLRGVTGGAQTTWLWPPRVLTTLTERVVPPVEDAYCIFNPSGWTVSEQRFAIRYKQQIIAILKLPPTHIERKLDRLVLLGSTHCGALTPKAYQRDHLLRILMITHLRVGFALRCFQRLSNPDIATQRCPWQDSWQTSGPFTRSSRTRSKSLQ